MVEQEAINLIKGCQKNNRDSQRKFFQICYGIFMPIAIRYSSSQEESKKLMNNAFLKLFEKINNINDSIDFLAWAKEEFVNYCIQQLLDKALSSKKDFCFEEGYLIDFDLDKINLDLELLLKSIQNLDYIDKLVFNLKVFENKKISEISKLIKTDEGDVALILKRAKNTIYKEIYKNEEN